MTASNGGALRLLWALVVKYASSFVLDVSLQTSHYKPQKAGEWMNKAIFSFHSSVRCDFQRAGFGMLRSQFVY